MDPAGFAQFGQGDVRGSEIFGCALRLDPDLMGFDFPDEFAQAV